MKQDLINKLNDKNAVIGVVGLGYVGIPLSLRFAEAGYKVLGLDIDPDKAEKISAGKTYIKHIPDEAIKSATDKGFRSNNRFLSCNRS